MAYSITPYKRDGVGKISAATSTTTTAATDRAFRNVAVGATIYASATSRTVSSKSSETSLVVNSAWTLSSVSWEYINPVLTLSGIYSVRHNKSDKPNVTPTTKQDADYTYAFPGDGVYREITVSGWIRSSTIADVYKNISILESLADGSQTKQGTCIYTEDVPPRSMYVYVTSCVWKYSNDNPKQVDVTISMVECRNKGST